jgi:hypothetical protein
MLAFIFTLLGCGPGHATTAFEACQDWAQGLCDCPTMVDAVDPNGNTACEADYMEGSCAMYDPAYCDTDDDKFDSEACERLHDKDEDYATEWFNCATKVMRDECDEDVGNAIVEECGDFPQD